MESNSKGQATLIGERHGMKSLSIAYITSRKEPKIEWFADSLIKQLDDLTEVIVVSYNDLDFIPEDSNYWIWRWTKPKPSIWQGEHRLTRDQWWAKSNAMNTAICLCQTDFIAFCDDRCVLVPEWLQCLRDAMEGNYAVCGSYEKRSGMKVENGKTLQNSGFTMKFDSRMRIIEDRTPSEIGGALKRADKDVHLGQKAKSWGVVRALKHEKTSQNPFDIRNMRARVLQGEPFPPPTGAHFDWFDQQPVSEMT